MSDPSNDNAGPVGERAEGHGEAALLLVESLIHGLLARASLSIAEAVDIVQDAIDVQCRIRDDRGEPSPSSPLLRIVDSLRVDDDRPY